MLEIDGHRWYDYTEAGQRVGRSVRVMKRWHSTGRMPTQLVNGHRLVREDHLLAAFREALKNWPTHHYRMRKLAAEAGLPAPTRPEAPQTPRRPKRPIAPDDVFEAVQDAPASPEVVIPGLTRGADEYAALMAALKCVAPACEGIDEFTDDKIDDETAGRLATICAVCPVWQQCAAFAAVSRPAGGRWAVNQRN